MNFQQRWNDDDKGLIISWESGRKMADNNPELAKRAKTGELVELPWKRGSWFYLAMWQGLKGESLNIDTSKEIVMTHHYTNSKGKTVEMLIKFPESGTDPEHYRKLKREGRVRELYFG